VSGKKIPRPEEKMPEVARHCGSGQFSARRVGERTLVAGNKTGVAVSAEGVVAEPLGLHLAGGPLEPLAQIAEATFVIDVEGHRCLHPTVGNVYGVNISAVRFTWDFRQSLRMAQSSFSILLIGLLLY